MILLEFVNDAVFEVVSPFTYLCNHFKSCCTGFTISVSKNL